MSIAQIIGSWAWNVGTEIVYSDEAFADVLAVPRRRAPRGAPVWDYLKGISDKDQVEIKERLNHVSNCSEDFEWEFRNKRDIWFKSTGRVVRDRRGRPAMYYGVAVELGASKSNQNYLDTIVDHCLSARSVAANADLGVIPLLLDMTLLEAGKLLARRDMPRLEVVRATIPLPRRALHRR